MKFNEAFLFSVPEQETIYLMHTEESWSQMTEGATPCAPPNSTFSKVLSLPGQSDALEGCHSVSTDPPNDLSQPLLHPQKEPSCGKAQVLRLFKFFL